MCYCDILCAVRTPYGARLTRYNYIVPFHPTTWSLGNHEYYTGDIDNWFLELPKLNVTPLVNRRVCLRANDLKTCSGGLYLAGLEDIETRRIKLVLERIGHVGSPLSQALC